MSSSADTYERLEVLLIREEDTVEEETVGDEVEEEEDERKDKDGDDDEDEGRDVNLVAETTEEKEDDSTSGVEVTKDKTGLQDEDKIKKRKVLEGKK